MTSGNFDKCLSLLLHDEGGYSNSPRDNGGPTNFGITQGTLDSWRTGQGRSSEPVRNITRTEAADIYRARYWDTVKGDQLPAGLDYVVFDGAVNSGPGRSVKWLQQALMLTMDGVIGPVTLAAASKADVPKAIADIKAIRMAFLRSHDDWDAFGRGWTNRVDGVTRDALAMTAPAPKPAPLPPQRAPQPAPVAADPWWVRAFRGIAAFLARLLKGKTA